MPFEISIITIIIIIITKSNSFCFLLTALQTQEMTSHNVAGDTSSSVQVTISLSRQSTAGGMSHSTITVSSTQSYYGMYISIYSCVFHCCILSEYLKLYTSR